MHARHLVVGLTVAAAAGLGGPTAGAQTGKPAISPSRSPDGLEFRTRQAGWTVWSTQIGSRWWMLGRSGSKTRLLDVPSSGFTHDPGVGRGASGRPTVVYQQCAQTACELWTLDLGSGAKRHLSWAGPVRRLDSNRSSSENAERETHPRIARGNVVFQSRVGGKWRVVVAPSAQRGPLRRLKFGPPAREVAGRGGGAFNLAIGPKHVMAHWVMISCGSLGSLCGRMDIVGMASRRTSTIDEYSGGEDCSSDVSDLQFDGKRFDWQKDASGDASSAVDCPVFTRRDAYDPAKPRG